MTILDWIIVGGYVAFSLTIGLIASRRVRGMSDYLVADRGVKFYLGVASLTGTEMGVISIMAMAELGYTLGFSAMTIGVCFMAGATFIGATGFIINGLRRHMVMTIPEFYEIRYNAVARWLAGFVMALAGVLNMGLFLKMSAHFFVGISGLDLQMINWIMAGLLIVVLSYTLLGGMMAVVLTDYFQYIILVAGVLAATVFVLSNVSFDAMYDVVSEQKGLPGFSPFAADDATGKVMLGWPFVLVNLLVFAAVPALWQPAASRALSATDAGIARRTTMWSGLTFLGRCSLPILWGIASLAYFSANPDALGGVDAVGAMPRFLAIVLPVGILGVVVAGMMAADMSTYNSYLLAWSGIITQDVIAPLVPGGLSDKSRLLVNRIVIVLCGMFILWMGLVYNAPDTFLQYQQISGAIYLSGAVACVVLGLYWKHANSAGAIAATLTGTLFPILSLYVNVESLPTWMQNELISSWLTDGWKSGVTAFAVAILTMIVVSLITNPWIRPKRIAEDDALLGETHGVAHSEGTIK